MAIYIPVTKCCISSSEPDIYITTSPSSHIMAGDTVALTCSVTLLTRVPYFQWEGPGVTPTPADPTISGQMISSYLTISEIAASQAGQYTCTTTSLSTSVIITVQSKDIELLLSLLLITMSVRLLYDYLCYKCVAN